VKSRRVWRKVQVIESETRPRFSYHSVDARGVTTTKEIPTGATTLAQLVGLQNVLYAQHLEGRVTQLKLYVQWQTPRLAAWAPAPLKPRTAEAALPDTLAAATFMTGLGRAR
jgi:hypothetical protein